MRDKSIAREYKKSYGVITPSRLHTTGAAEMHYADSFTVPTGFNMLYYIERENKKHGLFYTKLLQPKYGTNVFMLCNV